MHRNSEMTLNEVSTVVDARTSYSPPAGPSATFARRSPTTVGGKYRVSSKAGRVTPSPAKFESGSVPRPRARPALRGEQVPCSAWLGALDRNVDRETPRETS